MRCVHRDVVRDQSANPLVHVAANGLSASPEEAVMNDQQIRVLLDRTFDRARRCIDGDGAPRDWPDVLDLNAIHGAAIVGHLVRVQ
jgi:hypothetical protein